MKAWRIMLCVAGVSFLCGIFSAWAADDLRYGIERGLNYWCGLVMLNVTSIVLWWGYETTKSNKP